MAVRRWLVSDRQDVHISSGISRPGSPVLVRILACLCLAAALAALSACGGKPALPEKIKAEAQITTSEDLNPDVNGRPSPVVIVVLQLRSADKFNSADFFSLYDPKGTILGEDLLGRDQLTLQPGASRALSVEFDAETEFVGVVAAFRELEHAEWRALAEIPEKGIMDKVKFFSKDQLQISVDGLKVAVAFGG